MYNKNLKWIQDTATSNGFSGGKGGGSQKVLMQAQLGKIVCKVASHSLNIFVFKRNSFFFYCGTNTRGFQIEDCVFQSENWGLFQKWWGPVSSIWNPLSEHNMKMRLRLGHNCTAKTILERLKMQTSSLFVKKRSVFLNLNQIPYLFGVSMAWFFI